MPDSTIDPTEGPVPPLRTVGVIGGGTAGYFAAIALKRRFPDLDVTVVESHTIPIIGVGEATTTLMPPFLHAQLGIDVLDLYREVRPTWKLGIRFDWGLPGDYFFTYPFGESNPIEAHVFDGDIRTQSLTSLLMAEDKGPIFLDAAGQPESLLPRLKFAYHLDNAPFVRFLAKHAARLGVRHLDAIIDEAVTSPDGERVERLRLREGGELRFDLYIDASGFRSLLVGKTLGSPFESYASTLFCDTAVVAEVPQRRGVAPYTLAQSMECGWCWKIAVEGEDHRGYVFSSAFLSEGEAIDEMRAKNPGMAEPRIVRFRSGRHRDFWKGNVIAIGNAYGFVEPLESTALHMVIVELAYVIGCLAAAEGGESEPDRAFANKGVAGHWDYLRWFLGLHYKFNRRFDNRFWRTCREEVNVSGAQDAIDHFRKHGPWTKTNGPHFQSGDPAFGYSGVMILLLGQKVEGPVTTAVKREHWEARLAAQRRLVARALPQADCLALLRERPDLLLEFATSPASWCQGDAEAVATSPLGANGVHPRHAKPAFETPHEPLIEPIRPDQR